MEALGKIALYALGSIAFGAYANRRARNRAKRIMAGDAKAQRWMPVANLPRDGGDPTEDAILDAEAQRAACELGWADAALVYGRAVDRSRDKARRKYLLTKQLVLLKANERERYPAYIALFLFWALGTAAVFIFDGVSGSP